MSYYPRSGDMIIVDQDNSCYFNFLYYFVISLVYASFLTVVTDKLLDSESIDAKCPPNEYMYIEKRNDCDQIRKEYYNKRFVYLITLGLVSMIGGSFVAQLGPEYCTGGAGIAVGGSLIVVYQSLTNWYNLRTDVKIVMLSVSLLALFYGSIKSNFIV